MKYRKNDIRPIDWLWLIPFAILIVFLVTLPGAFIAMLLIGMVHAGWASFPALGFWPTWGLVLLISSLFNGVRRS